MHLAVDPLLPGRPGVGVMFARTGAAAGEKVDQKSNRTRVGNHENPGQFLYPAYRQAHQGIVEDCE